MLSKVLWDDASVEFDFTLAEALGMTVGTSQENVQPGMGRYGEPFSCDDSS